MKTMEKSMRLRPDRRLNVQVYEYVKQLLLDGELPHDECIPIEAIVSRLDVSRQPVMDAIKRLSQEGFLDVIPQVGSFPRQHPKQEILEFFQLFADSECLVAKLACEKADAVGIARLRLASQEIGQLRSLTLDDEELARQYRMRNRRFHTEMRTIGNSQIVSELVERMGDQSDFYVSQTHAQIFGKRLIDAHAEHEAMIDAIEAGDADKARKIIRGHVMAVCDRIAKAG